MSYNILYLYLLVACFVAGALFEYETPSLRDFLLSFTVGLFWGLAAVWVIITQVWHNLNSRK